jgi:hypothetical protein
VSSSPRRRRSSRRRKPSRTSSVSADVNDKPDGGSTVLDACLRHFGWKETVWDGSYLRYGHSTIPASRLGTSLEALRFLLKQQARWTPDARAIADARRALYRVDGEAIATVIDLLRTHQACDDQVMKTLVRTPKMRGILAADRRRARDRHDADAAVRRRTSRQPSPAMTATSPLPPSRYNRQRLYDEVWTEPTQKVAQRYGVSDVAIAKACTMLDIPKPPRGYWAKQAAGHTLPERPMLPKHDG